MLDYDLIPARRPDPTDRWLCLILHGLGDSKHGWQPVAPMLGLDRLGFAFAQAPIPYYGGGSWFDIGEAHRVDNDQIRTSRRLIDELVVHLLDQQKLPRSRLFVLGFSQGCLMTLDWGLRQDEPCAGLIGISGWVAMLEEYPAAFGKAALHQPILMTHGHDDQVIPIGSPRRHKDQLLALGVNLDWREYAKVHTLDDGDELPEIRAWMSAAMERAQT